MNNSDASLAEIAGAWAITHTPSMSEAEFMNVLAARINHLITEDFDQLLRLLYRIDVDEQRLKTLLHQFPDQDAGMLIARLILERQQQKIESRKQFNAKPPDPDRADAW